MEAIRFPQEPIEAGMPAPRNAGNHSGESRPCGNFLYLPPETGRRVDALAGTAEAGVGSGEVAVIRCRIAGKCGK